MRSLSLLGKKVRRRTVLLISSFVSIVVGVGIAGAIVLDRPAPGQPLSSGESASLRAAFVQRLEELDQAAQYAPAEESPFETLRVVANGQHWERASYRNAAGEVCELLVVPGEGRGYGCAAPSTQPLTASWGSRQIPDIRNDQYPWDEAWVSGNARQPITRVQLVLTDCSVLELPLTDGGGFLGVIGASVMHSGIQPHSLRGLSASGRLVATDFAAFPPATVAVGNIGPADIPANEHECK